MNDIGLIILVMGFALSNLGASQEVTAPSAEAASTDESDVQSVLDQSPIVSTRASGMGGALSTLADGLDAAYYNPAGIGGVHLGKTTPPVLRGLHFPLLGAAANENASNLNAEFSSQGGETDRAIGQAIIDASAGKRQYGRVSYAFDATISRTMVAAFADVQFAAIKEPSNGSGEGGISMKYRSLSGAGMGFSATDPQGRFYLGMFSSANNLTVMEADNASYVDVINTDRRKAILRDNSTKWTGVGTNAGILWNFAKEWRPTLGIVARDAGNTVYKPQGARSSGEPESLIIEQDLTAGFSISPELGKIAVLNVITEAHHLTIENMSLSKKFRAGVELLLDGTGSNSTFGLRTGYSSAGISYGANLNLGLIQIEAASEAIDIGLSNSAITERRYVAIFSTNMAND